MNAQQWLAAASPRWGLDYLCSDEVRANRRKAGRRKLRLFLCACARRVWDFIPDRAHREAVELGERLCEADDFAARVAVRVAAMERREVRGLLSRRHAAHAAVACVGTNIWHAAVTGADAAAMAGAWARVEAESPADMHAYQPAKAAEVLAQAALLREVVGNPFRRVELNPAWLRWNGGTLVAMARSIYEEREFGRLPLLADALTDAGCDDAKILEHCRSAGPHVRGCWVVDLLLGRGMG